MILAPLLLLIPALAPSAATESSTDIDLLPGFVENHGQWEEHVRFVGMIGDRGLAICEDRLVFFGPAEGAAAERDAVGAVAVALVFENVATSSVVTGTDAIGTKHSFFLGNDPGRWATDLPGYGRVRIGAVAPGIDAVISRDGATFRYDLDVAANADLSSFRMRIEGARGTWIAEDGCLHIDTGYGVLRQGAPRSWVHDESGARVETASRFVRLAADGYGFEAQGVGNGASGLIDPGLEWATLVGTKADFEDLEVDADGSVIAVGHTTSALFPTTPGAYDQSFAPYNDVFIARISTTGGSLVASTFYGGSTNEGSDQAAAVEILSGGDIAVCGRAITGNFPITPNAIDIGTIPSAFAFLGRFDAGLSILKYSGKIGNSGLALKQTEAAALTFIGNGSIVVAGFTSAELPVTPGVVDSTFGPIVNGREGWILQLHGPSWTSIDFLTYLGGSHQDYISSTEVASDGSIVVSARTRSVDFPMKPGGFDDVFGTALSTSFDDGAIVVLEADATAIRASSFLGGWQADYGHDLAIGPSGDITVVGETWSFDFPTTPGVVFPECDNGTAGMSGCVDGFVTRFLPDLSALRFSTFVGGAAQEQVGGVALDSADRPTVVGVSKSVFSYPTTPGAYQEKSLAAIAHFFVARLSADARRMHYSTCYSGTNTDGVTALNMAIDLDASGSATIGGITQSPNIPVTPGAYDTTWTSGNFVLARFDLLPKGVSRLGVSTSGCDGILAMEVTSMPYPGNPDFGVTCLAAPANATGFLVLGATISPTPIPLSGAQLFVGPQGLVMVPVLSDALGYAEVSAPLRAGATPPGATIVGQFLWPDPCATKGVSASQALVMTVQSL